jgi:hypothetical protein
MVVDAEEPQVAGPDAPESSLEVAHRDSLMAEKVLRRCLHPVGHDLVRNVC